MGERKEVKNLNNNLYQKIRSEEQVLNVWQRQFQWVVHAIKQAV